MRLIDKDALMKELGIAEDCKDCQYRNGELYCDLDSDGLAFCEKIAEAPTIKLKSCWTLCKEQLPEEKQGYFVL